MTTLAGKKIHTFKDYEKLPEGAPYQLIGGDLIMTPSPTPQHQLISRRIEYALLKFLEDKNLGEVLDAPIDVYLSDAETYQPDIIYISKERLDIIGEKKIEAAPDLVIEILFPSTAYYDLKHKRSVYEKSGVREYWIADPMEKSIEVYENTDSKFERVSYAVEKGRAESKLLKGFGVEVEKVF